MFDMNRYKRQIIFEGIGEEGQERLLNSRVCIIGAGALGAVVANDLCRSGVGYLRIIDRDFVEKSNLQRQILFTENDAAENLPKVLAAYNHLIDLLNRAGGSRVVSLCGDDSWQILPEGRRPVDLEVLAGRLEKLGTVKTTKFILHFQGQGVSFKLFPDGRAIIRDVKDKTAAIKRDYVLKSGDVVKIFPKSLGG
jgi:hypothetical protein